jgi:hypothetical protein
MYITIKLQVVNALIYFVKEILPLSDQVSQPKWDFHSITI